MNNNFSTLPKSRAEAKKLNQKYYVSIGTWCPKGHISKRMTRDHSCYQCHLDRLKVRQAKKRKAKPQQANHIDVSIFGDKKIWLTHGLSSADKYRLRYNLDTEFRVKERLRRQINKMAKRDGIADVIRSAIKRDGNSPTTERVLGYTIKSARAHLERQFTKGMTWEAFMKGHIHIDHIIPQSSFDLSIDSEWRRCWCLTNLRPMWSADNLRKSNKIECLL